MQEIQLDKVYGMYKLCMVLFQVIWVVKVV